MWFKPLRVALASGAARLKKLVIKELYSSFSYYPEKQNIPGRASADYTCEGFMYLWFHSCIFGFFPDKKSISRAYTVL